MFVGLGLDCADARLHGAVAAATCLLFGLLPALRATRSRAGRGDAGGRPRHDCRPRALRLRRVLVTAQVALSLVLLVGALLFVRSLQKLLAVDAGFRPGGHRRGRPGFPRGALPQGAAARGPSAISGSVCGAVPGVVSAAQVCVTPISGRGWNEKRRPDGSTEQAKSSSSIASARAI